MWTKFPARRRFAMKNTQVHTVQCNGTVYCPGNATCCVMASGEYGCCPLPDAVCCSDKIHCCPQGTTCVGDTGECQRKHASMRWRTKMPAVVKGAMIDVKCNATTSCPAGETCCKQPSGDWGCCPIPLAVCCEDHEHCCPNGYTCNLASETCEKQSVSVPAIVKPSPASASVKCDDEVQCPSPATCCKVASGSWACCPYEQATCCEDEMHCCPYGYKCNMGAEACTLQRLRRWDLFFPKHMKTFNTL